jgi:hypothetical protein
MKVNPQYVNGYKSPGYHAKVRRDNYAHRLIWWAFRRWILNEDHYRVVTRFTGPRPRGTCQDSTLKANAHSFRYYIQPRHRGPWL